MTSTGILTIYLVLHFFFFFFFWKEVFAPCGVHWAHLPPYILHLAKKSVLQTCTGFSCALCLFSNEQMTKHNTKTPKHGCNKNTKTTPKQHNTKTPNEGSKKALNLRKQKQAIFVYIVLIETVILYNYYILQLN